MAKSFSCSELGGVCDERFSGDTLEEIIKKGMEHMMSDEAHKTKISNMSNDTGETKEEWLERMQKEFDTREDE
ncbi:MAG: DUF1059 domain-containing protein [Candidatus Harrisonbacteria bacterium CG10_big_fil_rev_8_21_14_0_10_40_38]|uniref:DUF1059 domain-containing protein n=1 Tax=Candidatus Harrisonbacteria bacterium CG10_big_fil_rev_8_21_14_0_10_40_38 TaxID=1974583 RepID=A0A2H0URX7_9BACT|nr:MAG: DUF1059 domain-containing protein [Candidatus Harrisonbacteria bacterium CG10_big_fil_rev_8_21_14_0_10_40_38]